MVKKDLIAAKLAELADRIHRVRTHVPATVEALAQDRDALDLVSFNLMLGVQACADIALHVLADEGWAVPTELRGAFERLEEHGVISRATRTSLARAVGLRNIVAHGYGVVDPSMVHAAAVAGLADLERFAQEIAVWVASRP